MTLSTRLAAVLELLEPCETFADIGTDHGHLLVAAVRSGKARRALGVDLNQEPLEGARLSVQRARLEDQISLMQGDGFAPLAGRADAVAIAGLTGPTVERLCRTGPRVGVRQLLLQPVRDLHRLRAWALEAGWHLRDERVVWEGERFFAAAAFVPGEGPDPAYQVPGWTQAALTWVGPHCLARRDPTARAWCEGQRIRTARWASTGPEAAAEAAFWAETCARWDGPGP